MKEGGNIRRPQGSIIARPLTHVRANGAGGPAPEPGDRRLPLGRVLGQARDLLSDRILGGLEERQELHQTGKSPGGPRAQPELPDSSS